MNLIFGFQISTKTCFYFFIFFFFFYFFFFFLNMGSPNGPPLFRPSKIYISIQIHNQFYNTSCKMAPQLPLKPVIRIPSFFSPLLFHFSIVSPLFVLRYSSRRYCFIFQRIVSFFNRPAVNRLTLIISPLLFHFLQSSRPKE